MERPRTTSISALLLCDQPAQRPERIGPRGFEPLTSSTPNNESPVASVNLSQVTAISSARCTPRCTENPNEANSDPLAGFVAGLTAADRARLVALLTGLRGGGKAAPGDSTGPAE